MIDLEAHALRGAHDTLAAAVFERDAIDGQKRHRRHARRRRLRTGARAAERSCRRFGAVGGTRGARRRPGIRQIHAHLDDATDKTSTYRRAGAIPTNHCRYPNAARR
ncbi:hypothetical protein [Burkholderia glumae]|uniref:hypothetical protein n=1 Tax=Burkholderia glumae TaxID=337 RepID=UPI00214F8ACC|nr:hypothetical protein [Burkholderia glumae]